jgi:hypothetical protein
MSGTRTDQQSLPTNSADSLRSGRQNVWVTGSSGVASTAGLLCPRRAHSGLVLVRIVSFCLALCLAGAVEPGLHASPAIVITNLPAYGSTANLSGLVGGVDYTNFAVAVYIFVPGYGWVSKPNCATVLTPINPDGSWSADITTGGTDSLATRVAAMVVPRTPVLPCIQGQPFLTNAYAAAVANAVVTRPFPGPRWIRFGGYDWWVKSSASRVGPGPNYFSDSTNNVWLDGAGNLHLRMTSRSNQWQCAEVVSARSFGYGSYRFRLLSDVNTLDRNVVLGLFTWSDDPNNSHREIDVECSRWGNAADTRNSQFVVQPFDLAGHLVRYSVPGLVTNATHSFNWESNRVVFQCQRGAFSPAPVGSNLVAEWTYTLSTPQPGDENVRLNLWLTGGTPPANGQEAEIVIQSFQFVPTGPPSSARLLNLRGTPEEAEFSLVTEPDRWYALQSSEDLIQWSDDRTFLATNFMEFGHRTTSGASRRFFRAVTLP